MMSPDCCSERICGDSFYLQDCHAISLVASARETNMSGNAMSVISGFLYWVEQSREGIFQASGRLSCPKIGFPSEFPRIAPFHIRKRNRSNRTTEIILFAMIFLSSTASISYAEIAEAPGLDMVSFVEIQAETASVSEVQGTGIKTILFARENKASVNGDGSIWVANKQMIRRGPGGFEVLDIPGTADFTYTDVALDWSGQYLARVNQDRRNLSITLLDTGDFSVVSDFSFAWASDMDSLIHFAMSDNASTLAYTHFSGKEKVMVIENENGNLSMPTQVDRAEIVTGRLILSSLGNRLFYQARRRAEADETGKQIIIAGAFFVERESTGWGDVRIVRLPEVEDSKIIVHDAANAGESILVSITGQGFALLHRTLDGWSEPEFLGYVNTGRDIARISEDGRIVAIAIARLPLVDQRTSAIQLYDLFVFIRRDSGAWLKTQVNRPAYPVFRNEFLLSGNGRKLYWIPDMWWPSATSPDWMMLR